MDENLPKELSDELKARINNPLIGSFVISWFFWNWKIFVLLVFYKQAELKLNRYTSFLDVVYKNTDIWRNLLLPLASAIIYILVSPFVKRWITLYLKRRSVVTDNRLIEENIKVVTFKKKLLEKDVLIQQEKLKVTERESAIATLNGKINELEIELSNSARELGAKVLELENANERKKYNDHLNSLIFLDGRWRAKINGYEIEDLWTFKNDKIFQGALHEYTIESQIGYNDNLWLDIQEVSSGIRHRYRLSISTHDRFRIVGQDERNTLIELTKVLELEDYR